MLAVEINFNRPAFARLFNLDNRKTLSAVASGSMPAGEAFTEVETGFSVLPLGKEIESARGRLAQVLRQVLTAANESFDAVLIDAPPLLETGDAFVAAKVNAPSGAGGGSGPYQFR